MPREQSFGKVTAQVTFPHESGKSVPSTGDRSRGPGRNAWHTILSPLPAELQGLLGGHGGLGESMMARRTACAKALRQGAFLPVQRMARSPWLEWMSKEMWERRGQRSNEVCGMKDEGIQIHIPRKAVVTREATTVNTLLPIAHRLPLLCFLSQHTCRF